MPFMTVLAKATSRPARAGHYFAIAALALAAVALPHAQEPTERLGPLDFVLDTYVRGGEVYYRALKSDRGRLDTYVKQLANTDVDKLPRNEQIAFWLNAYNASVLHAVASHYPPRENSIRKVPGIFDKRVHRLAGRSVTLDEIENTVLPEFRDPRLYFALGRGAIGSGRLRSEAYTAARLEDQLANQTREFLSRQNHVHVDVLQGELRVSPIIGWHEAEFVAAYGDAEAAARFANRSPIERAVLALVDPVLLPSERQVLRKGDFKVVYQDFDWSLNELK
jgi:hypothetical protein